MPTLNYTIIAQQPDARFDNALGKVTEGFKVIFYDPVTGGTYNVFVAADVYSPQNVNTAIQNQLNTLHGVASLGKGAPPAEG